MSSTNNLMLDEIKIRDRILRLDLWYPRSEENADTVELGLMDVRAADPIRIQYDFDRDGWIILQSSKFEWEVDEDPIGDWQEVAFIQAWNREQKK